MTKALKKQDTEQQIALPGTGDPFGAYADSVTPSTIVGTLLKFSKGEFLAGRDGEVIPAGTRFIAGMDALAVGWVKWRLGRPADHALVRVVEGKLPAKREELGDLDQEQWEYDSRGERRDPWQQVNYLPLLDNQNEVFTFSVTSNSGIREIGALARAYADYRKANVGDDFPLVELNVDSYQHPDQRIGKIKYPRFDVVGWVPKRKFADALAEVTTEPRSQHSSDRIETSPKRMAETDDMADEILF